MKKIPLSNVIDISKDKLHYRDDNGKVVDIELALCANNYESTHNIINKNGENSPFFHFESIAFAMV